MSSRTSSRSAVDAPRAVQRRGDRLRKHSAHLDDSFELFMSPMPSSTRNKENDASQASSLFLTPNTNAAAMLVTPHHALDDQLKQGRFQPDEDKLFHGKQAAVMICKKIPKTPGSHLKPQAYRGATPAPAASRAALRTPLVTRPPRTPQSTTAAIKTQEIGNTKDINDQCYHEVFVYKALALLGLPNFTRMDHWFKSAEGTSENMNIVLERADMTLLDLINRPRSDGSKGKQAISLSLLRGILFQLLYALHVAQNVCRFTHNDLHSKNILLKRRPQHVDAYLYSVSSSDDLCWRVDCEFVAKLNDFGHSTVKLPTGEVLERKAVLTFSKSTDMAKVKQNLDSVRIDYSELSEQEAKQASSLLTQLKKLMGRVDKEPVDMLRHDFFKPLLCNREETLAQQRLRPQPKGRLVIIRQPTQKDYVEQANHEEKKRDVEMLLTPLVDAFARRQSAAVESSPLPATTETIAIALNDDLRQDGENMSLSSPYLMAAIAGNKRVSLSTLPLQRRISFERADDFVAPAGDAKLMSIEDDDDDDTLFVQPGAPSQDRRQSRAHKRPVPLESDPATGLPSSPSQGQHIRKKIAIG